MLGTWILQPTGYKAFIPSKFPPAEELFRFDTEGEVLHANAAHLLGKLDGITQLLPDLDFFLFMYLRKEATLSNQIEGTRATLIDALEDEAQLAEDLPADVKKIQQYVQALNYGLQRLDTLPLSLRLIREIHSHLLTDIGDERFSPGEFRTSQNWIGGATPNTATYVPPPVNELERCLDDFEKFLHVENTIVPLVRVALAHAQFETIHPFLDGNGRTGRLLIPVYMHKLSLLEKPVLYVSEYFRKHRELYFTLLANYHNKSEIAPWVNFFLNGVATIALDAIETVKKITELRERDMQRIQQLGQSASIGTDILIHLYKLPIVDVHTIREWTSYTEQGSRKLINKLVDIGILVQRDREKRYKKSYVYREYLNIFL